VNEEYEEIMTQVRITVLAMFAVLALSAVVASSASAALPEITTAGSTLAPTGEITGKSKAGTKTVLETAAGTTVKCESAVSKGGKATNTKESKGTKVTFKGCSESFFGGKCQNTATAGEIVTNEISTLIGYIVGSKQTEVGLELYPTATTAGLKISEGAGAAFVTFECTGGFAKIQVQGAVIGTLGNAEHKKATHSLSLNFAKGATAGSQKVTEIEGGKMKNVHLESSLNKGTFENSNQQAEGFLEVLAEEIELKA
jgi:hypothetical protein